MKNIITELKCLLMGSNRRLKHTEERISKIENISFEITVFVEQILKKQNEEK